MLLAGPHPPLRAALDVLSLLPPESLFGGGDDAAATSQWLEAETAVCWAAIQLFQQLTAAQAAGRLVVVAPASTTGALSIGASKTFSLEYPEAFVQRVFVAGGSAAGLAVAVEAAAAWPAETDILAELPASSTGSQRGQSCRWQPGTM